MKKAILIQCHQNADQINFLIEHLHSDQHSIDIYIHVDAKSHIINEIAKGKNIFFVEKRVDVRWGSFSQVLATLELLKMTADKGYDYISLISGQDFPVYSLDQFCAFLEKNKKKLFLELFTLPDKRWKYAGGTGRLSYHWFNSLVYRKNKLIKFFSKLLSTSIGKLFPKDITPLGNLYGGSQWFTISGEAADYCIKFIHENPKYTEFYQHSLCADEVFFQTLFMNSPFTDSVENKNLRYIKWKKGSGSPEVLTNDDFEDIIKSGAFFMRKVDINISKELIQRCVKENFSENISENNN